MNVEAGGQIASVVSRYAKRVALTTPQGSQTFQELNGSANRVASGLLENGLARGDRVGVLAYNRIEVAQLWLGMEKWNLARVVLHSHFDFAIHVKTLNHVGAGALVFDTRFSDAIAAHKSALTSVKLFVAIGPNPPPWAVSIETVSALGRATDPQLDVDENKPCFLQLTTGTTGEPKPWIVTYRSWRAVISGNVEHLDTFAAGAIGPDDVSMHFHALQWATGFQTLMPYLLRGARSVLVDDERFDPEQIVDTLVREQVTGVFIPGPMLTPILDVVEARGGVAHSLKRMMIFFATPEQLERVTKLFGPVWCHGFGSTEQGAPTTRLLPGDAAEDAGRLVSVGRSISPFYEIAVMDDEGQRLGAGEIGEIVVRSPMCASEYWNLPDKTTESFFGGGWFRPRDVGYLDAQGFLYFLDRAKDCIVTAQGTVYPHPVEAALLRHDAVANCGVVGLGQTPKQLVVAGVLLKPGVKPSEELAQAILRGTAQLKSGERPERIFFVDELPTVLGGAKVQREVLRDRLAAQSVAA